MDKVVDIIHKHCSREGYRLNIVKIHVDVLNDILHEAPLKNKTGASGSTPRPEAFQTDKAQRVVTEMGHEPYVKALKEHSNFDVVVAGRAHQAAPYVAHCLANGVHDLGLACHLGMMMKDGASRATPPSRAFLVGVWQHKFEITPLNPKSQCTLETLAAHSL